jgi:hypothetical protein
MLAQRPECQFKCQHVNPAADFRIRNLRLEIRRRNHPPRIIQQADQPLVKGHRAKAWGRHYRMKRQPGPPAVQRMCDQRKRIRVPTGKCKLQRVVELFFWIRDGLTKGFEHLTGSIAEPCHIDHAPLTPG